MDKIKTKRKGLQVYSFWKLYGCMHRFMYICTYVWNKICNLKRHVRRKFTILVPVKEIINFSEDKARSRNSFLASSNKWQGQGMGVWFSLQYRMYAYTYWSRTMTLYDRESCMHVFMHIVYLTSFVYWKFCGKRTMRDTAPHSCDVHACSFTSARVLLFFTEKMRTLYNLSSTMATFSTFYIFRRDAFDNHFSFTIDK